MDDRLYYIPPADLGPLPAPVNKPRRRVRRQSPQTTVQQFWAKFNAQHPGKVFTILPSNPYKEHRAPGRGHIARSQRAARSYDEARASCIRNVDRIVRECRRNNQKYRDPHFDIEWDLKSRQRNCLDGLDTHADALKPNGVKRVTDIFEKPQFYINGPTAGDVRQGRDGDCYLMAALCGLGNMEGLIDKVCVKQDQDVGVYGFVFYRDGEWQQTIVDDKLYLRAPDYNEAQDQRVVWDDIARADSEEEYRKAHQTGSRALYFAQCSDENETWLPLLEKAYAKAHGDYSSLDDGGFTGEAIEDLTGGVTCEIYSTDILDREAFWRNELMQVGKSFLFGCATGFFSNWLDTTGANTLRERQGISEGHAYSIMDAREIKGHKLLKLRNPWGKKEWDGKWSDGSAEWDGEWMTALGHKFGNDGVFWISYEDLLKKYQHFDRTRIFGPEWIVSQCWTSVDVSWSAQYHSTKFSLTLTEKAPVVIVLSQLDASYYNGLEGNYRFDLQFTLEDASNSDADDYIVRSNGRYAMSRSVNTDIELEAGTYNVLMKITATRDDSKDMLEEVLPLYAATKREKLIQMGRSYDVAHAKGVYVETKQERNERKQKEKERKLADREEAKNLARKRAEKHWKKEKVRHERTKRRRLRKEKADAKRGRAGRRIVVINEPADDFEDHGERNGSLDVHVDGSIKSDEGQPIETNRMNGQVTDDGPVEKPVTLRLKSFTGETIEVSKASNDKSVAEQETAQPTAVSQTPTDPQATADSLVQHLSEVIKTSDAAADAGIEEKPPTPIIQVNGQDAVTDVKPLPNLPPLSAEEHTLPAPTLPKGSISQQPSQEEFDAGVHDNEDNASVDSYPSFDWNSDLDMPSDYDSDASSSSSSTSSTSTSASHAGAHPHQARPRSPSPSLFPILHPSARGNRQRRRRRSSRRDISPPSAIHIDISKSDDEATEDPWNAVCVVGLRVYSTLKPGALSLKVVRPSVDDDAGEKKGRKERKKKKKGKGKGMAMGVETKLDPDDMNKGAVLSEAAAAAASARAEEAAEKQDGPEVQVEEGQAESAARIGQTD